MLPFGPDPLWGPDPDWYRNTWERPDHQKRRRPVIAPVLLAVLAAFFVAALHAS